MSVQPCINIVTSMKNNVTTALRQQSNHSTNPVLINLTQCWHSLMIVCMHVINVKFLQQLM